MIDFRHAAMVLALGAGATTASAQTTIITREPQNRVVVQQVELTPPRHSTISATTVLVAGSTSTTRLLITM